MGCIPYLVGSNEDNEADDTAQVLEGAAAEVGGGAVGGEEDVRWEFLLTLLWLVLLGGGRRREEEEEEGAEEEEKKERREAHLSVGWGGWVGGCEGVRGLNQDGQSSAFCWGGRAASIALPSRSMPKGLWHSFACSRGGPGGSGNGWVGWVGWGG